MYYSIQRRWEDEKGSSPARAHAPHTRTGDAAGYLLYLQRTTHARLTADGQLMLMLRPRVQG